MALVSWLCSKKPMVPPTLVLRRRSFKRFCMFVAGAEDGSEQGDSPRPTAAQQRLGSIEMQPIQALRGRSLSSDLEDGGSGSASPNGKMKVDSIVKRQVLEALG